MTGVRYAIFSEAGKYGWVSLYRAGFGWTSARIACLQDAYAWLFRRGLFDREDA